MLDSKFFRNPLALAGLLACLVPAPVFAQTAETPNAALSRNIRILAAEPRNFDALIGAGRAALEMGDVQAAAGFFGRAEELRPTDWRAQVGVGAAMVQMGDVSGALSRFAQAQRAGAPLSSFAIDRGMAHDLSGDLRDAQADYRSAFGSPNEQEARRRLALSLAMSKKRTEAIEALQPLLNQRDPGAQRSRAFVLALLGDRAGAAAAIEAVMPGNSARFEPFFRYLPNLNTREKAAAVHLGIFPEDAATRLAEVEPEPVAITHPVKVAAAEPPKVRSSRTAPRPEPEKQLGPAIVAQTRKTEPTTAGVQTMIVTVPSASGSIKTTLAEQQAQRERIARVVPKPLVTPPLPAVTEEVEPVKVAGAPEFSEPLVPVDTSPTSIGDAVPVGDSEVRLSGIDRLLATIAEDAPPPPAPKPKLDNGKAAKQAREAKLAEAKKLADKKVADAKAAELRKAKEAKELADRLGVAGTYWVQLAGGSNRNNMAAEYKKLSAKSSALKKRSGYVTQGKGYYRLVVGPFDDKAEAQAFVNTLAKQGVDGFSWTRTPAQIKIEKLP